MNHAGSAPLSLHARDPMWGFLDDATAIGAIHMDGWETTAEAYHQSAVINSPVAIERRVLDLTERRIDGLRSKGYQVVAPTKQSERSGTMVFRSNRHTPTALSEILQQANVIGAERRGGRLSQHSDNSEEEITRVLDVLP